MCCFSARLQQRCTLSEYTSAHGPQPTQHHPTCRQSALLAVASPSGGRSSRATTAVLSCATAVCSDPRLPFMPASDCKGLMVEGCWCYGWPTH